ncbi:MAG: alpha/beta fold hydrolase [Deltaproteobacteria bacterium]|nr:alpha/beta fold hydrolase [Deltaproteobacteria bacterium]
MRIDRKAWGERAQLAATVADLEDVKHNKDGIWDNENKPANTVGSWFDRNPLALRAQKTLEAGVSVGDEIEKLAAFRKQAEVSFGQPVMDAAIEASLNGGALFAAQKAITLTRLGRSPADVFERFVEASGSVDGVAVPKSRVFTQHFLPEGKPTGDVVVMSPGFLETGRAFHDQISELTQHGVHVVTLDHQWAGHTQGKRGGISNGESIALHVAAVCADAFELAKERYGSSAKLTLVGESMGGGPGAFGAALMNDQGRLLLDGGKSMPKGVSLVLQAPYFGATPSFLNATLKAAATIPILNKLEMPAIGLPDFVEDDVGEHKVAQAMVREDIRGQLAAFKASDAFLAKLMSNIEKGERPGGKVYVLHDQKDPLADFAKVKSTTATLGGELTVLSGGDHGLSASDPKACVDVILGALG